MTNASTRSRGESTRKLPDTGSVGHERAEADGAGALGAQPTLPPGDPIGRMETIRKRDAAFRRALAVADAVVVGLVLLAGAVIFGEDGLTPMTAVAAVFLVLLMKAVGLYDRDENLLHKTTLDEIPALFGVATLSCLLLYLAGDVIVDGDLGRRQVLGMWGMLFVLLIIGRSLARYAARAATPVERCLLLGDEAAAEAVRRSLLLSSAVKAELVGWLPLERSSNGSGGPTLPEPPKNLSRVLIQQDVHRVILAPGRVATDAFLHLVYRLHAHHVSVSVLPATPTASGSNAVADDIHGLSLLGVRSFQIGRSSRLLKRTFDLAGSSLLLVAIAPLLLAVAVAIRLDSPGPILFRQRRIGRHGEPFEMLKFRSMHEGAHRLREELRSLSDADGLFKIEHDPRVTGVGRVIRRWSLDELPQLANVLKGEMSLVGPRPLVPEEDSLIEGLYRRRLDLAPGITGYWQALGSSRIPLGEMVRLDYVYVANWSLWHDVRILLRTVPYVVGRRGR